MGADVHLEQPGLVQRTVAQLEQELVADIWSGVFHRALCLGQLSVVVVAVQELVLIAHLYCLQERVFDDDSQLLLNLVDIIQL